MQPTAATAASAASTPEVAVFDSAVRAESPFCWLEWSLHEGLEAAALRKLSLSKRHLFGPLYFSLLSGANALEAEARESWRMFCRTPVLAS